MDLYLAKKLTGGGGGRVVRSSVNLCSISSPLLDQHSATIWGEISVEGLVLWSVVTMRSPSLRE